MSAKSSPRLQHTPNPVITMSSGSNVMKATRWLGTLEIDSGRTNFMLAHSAVSGDTIRAAVSQRSARREHGGF
jgi:hypothetical protein